MDSSASKPTLLLYAIVIIAAVLGAAYFYSRQRAGSDQKQWEKLTKEVKIFHQQGNYEKTIETFKAAVRFAPTKYHESEVKRHMAGILMVRNLPGDRIEAVRLFKEVVNDNMAQAKEKALALSDMAFAFTTTGENEGFMRQVVFNEEPYATYLRESKTGIYGGLRRLYEESDKFFPTAFAKLGIADNYALPLFAGKTDAGLTPLDTAKLIKKTVDEAIPLMDDLPYENLVIAHMYLMRATSLSVTQMFIKDVVMEEIENAYKRAITTAEKVIASDDRLDSQHVPPTLAISRLFYAMTLTRVFGKTRVDDIATLLKPIINREAGYEAAISYIKNANARQSSALSKKRLISISKLVPEFRKLLQNLGWNI